MRRSKSIETLLPVLYLRGISTGDFSEALAALLGKDAAGLSASAIGRLKDGWLDDHTAWQRRDLSAKRYVYIWADGIHLQTRLEDEKQCILVLIGATPEGRKELVGFTDGARESAQDWRDLLLDLKRRGLDVPPQLTIADGALGFWKAAGEVWPKTREQRCWVHKTANVLAKLPKSQQPKAKRALQEIWMAETKAVAELAFDAFIESYTPKYEKAADCLSRDRDALLAFYDFPAEHWKHLRTTNPIESTFATVRHRTIRSKGRLSNKTALAMVFKLLEAAQKSWRRLDGHNQLPKLVLGVTFNDGIEVIAKPTDLRLHETTPPRSLLGSEYCEYTRPAGRDFSDVAARDGGNRRVQQAVERADSHVCSIGIPDERVGALKGNRGKRIEVPNPRKGIGIEMSARERSN